MDEKNTQLALHEPASYEILVYGYLGERWIDYVQGMAIKTEHCGEPPHVVTLLTGILPDQAALVGVINFLYDQRFVLLQVKFLGKG